MVAVLVLPQMTEVTVHVPSAAGLKPRWPPLFVTLIPPGPVIVTAGVVPGQSPYEPPLASTFWTPSTVPPTMPAQGVQLQGARGGSPMLVMSTLRGIWMVTPATTTTS